MEFTLKEPLQVYSKDEGDYLAIDKVNVSFKGKKGVIKLKSLQDIVFQTFQETAKSNNSDKKKTDKDEDVKVDDILNMLEMTGHSERVFVAVTDALKYFAKAGNEKLTDKLQDEMNEDDLDDLYKEVLKTFLLPKVIRMMNSMKK